MTINLKYISIFPVILCLLLITIAGALSENKDGFDTISSQDTELCQFVILQNNSFMAISNPSNPEPKIAKKIRVVVTAYSSTPWETWGDPFITAAGTGVRDGIVANNLLPFGTKVRFPEIYGDKIFMVEDRMNSRKGHYHFDIWFPEHWQALNFGAKRTYIEVLEN